MRYQDVRMERTARVVTESAANTARFHNRTLADPEKAGEYVQEQWLPERVRERYDWLFVYDATTVEI